MTQNWWEKPTQAEPPAPVATPAPVAAPAPVGTPLPLAKPVVKPIDPPGMVSASKEQDKAGTIWVKDYSMKWTMQDHTTSFTAVRVTKVSEKHPDWRGDNFVAWEKTYGGGKKMLSITFGPKDDQKKFVAFQNSHKKASNQPDFYVFVSKPRPVDV
jgi:hypothetical protein